MRQCRTIRVPIYPDGEACSSCEFVLISKSVWANRPPPQCSIFSRILEVESGTVKRCAECLSAEEKRNEHRKKKK